MKTKLFAGLACLALCLTTLSAARADNVIYSNMTSATGATGFFESDGWMTDENSFASQQNSIMNTVLFVADQDPGYVVNDLKYWIFTNLPSDGATIWPDALANSNVVASGEVDPTLLSQTGTAAFGWPTAVETLQFSTADINLTAGTTYYLALQGIASSPNDWEDMYWDESDGPSTSYQYSNGLNVDPSSASFEILDGAGSGAPSVVPEPGTFGLLGSGLFGLLLLARKTILA